MRTTVFIGRLQPFHVGHYTIVKRALEISDRLIIVLGSTNQPRTLKDPFTPIERAEIIRAALTDEENARVVLAHVYDANNFNVWKKEVEMVVETLRLDTLETFTLIGHKKDESSYYLNFFEKWGFEEFEMTRQVSATGVRNAIFREPETRLPLGDYQNQFFVNETHRLKLEDVIAREEFQTQVMDMADEARETRRKYGPGPYVTCDSIVTWNDSILLVKRGNHPFRGFWALPGGFLEDGETTIQGAIREGSEETGFDIPPAFHSSSLIADDPDRDPRGRIIGVVHHFNIPENFNVGDVAGADDAIDAQWFDLNDVRKNMRTSLAFDHYNIIERILQK